jgi:hypothetical protein
MPADDPIRELALAAIDADHQITQLLQSGAAHARIPISTLYRFATDPGFDMSAELAARLDHDAVAQADLERIIAKSAMLHMPRLAAAASETNARRETDQAVLTLTPSRADPGQVYLIIELRDPDAPRPSQLFAGSAGTLWCKLSLPPFSGSRTQVLIESDDAVVVALANPESVVYLR